MYLRDQYWDVVAGRDRYARAYVTRSETLDSPRPS
jgi:hypothetical protein